MQELPARPKVKTRYCHYLFGLLHLTLFLFIFEVEWCPLDVFQRMFEVNALGVVRVTKAFLPLLRESQGRVVVIASMAGKLHNVSYVFCAFVYFLKKSFF